MGLTIQPQDHEAASPNVPSLWINDSERKIQSDGCIDDISPASQDFRPNFTRDAVCADHHAGIAVV